MKKNVLTNKLKPQWKEYSSEIKPRNPLGGNFVRKMGAKRIPVLANNIGNNRQPTFTTSNRSEYGINHSVYNTNIHNFSIRDMQIYNRSIDSLAYFAKLNEDIDSKSIGPAPTEGFRAKAQYRGATRRLQDRKRVDTFKLEDAQEKLRRLAADEPSYYLTSTRPKNKQEIVRIAREYSTTPFNRRKRGEEVPESKSKFVSNNNDIPSANTVNDTIEPTITESDISTKSSNTSTRSTPIPESNTRPSINYNISSSNDTTATTNPVKEKPANQPARQSNTPTSTSTSTYSNAMPAKTTKKFPTKALIGTAALGATGLGIGYAYNQYQNKYKNEEYSFMSNMISF